MGFAASQARMIMLVQRQSDLEIQGQFIQQARLQLANVVGAMWSITSNLEPETPEAQQIQAQIAAIQTQDKSLETNLSRLDSQRKAVSTERDAVQKVLTENITKSFKTFA